MSDSPFILSCSSTAPFERRPKKVSLGNADLPIHFLEKEIIPIGDTRTHPDKGYKIHVTPERADGWIQTFGLMTERGRRVPAPPTHKDASKSLGQWVGFSRKANPRGGESLFGELMVIGDRTLEEVLNAGDVSILTRVGLKDDLGNEYPEAIDHVSVTPFPALTKLGGWTSIAASRGGEAEDVPVFEVGGEVEAVEPAPAAAPIPGPSRVTLALASEIAGFPVRSRAAIACCLGMDDCECDDEEYVPDASMLPEDFEPDAPLLDLNCGTGAGGFKAGNTCAKGGYGRDNSIRTSRTTKGNIAATGAKETRRYKDSSGRQVVEHRTDDGRVFHEVTHAAGRRTFHQVHGAAKAKKARADAKSGGSIPADNAEFARRVQAAAHSAKAAGEGVSAMGDQVQIAHVHKHYEKLHGPTPLADFKDRLLKQNGDKGTVLVHEDMRYNVGGRGEGVAQMHPNSEARKGASTYHHVLIDSDAPKASGLDRLSELAKQSHAQAKPAADPDLSMDFLGSNASAAAAIESKVAKTARELLEDHGTHEKAIAAAKRGMQVSGSGGAYSAISAIQKQQQEHYAKVVERLQTAKESSASIATKDVAYAPKSRAGRAAKRKMYPARLMPQVPR